MTIRRLLQLAAIFSATGTTLAPPLVAGARADDEVLRREAGAATVTWRSPVSATDPVAVRLLGLNDLHGQLQARARAETPGGSRPMGGAAVLAAYLASERDENPRRTLLLIAGDSIGASAAVSGLLRDEPTMAFLNELAAGDCPRITRAWAAQTSPVPTRCRVVATVGNHEFDKGTLELERLLYGGKHPAGPVLGHDWGGMKIPYVAANVVRRDGQAAFLPGSAIVELDGVRIGVIGAVTTDTPALVPAERIRELQFMHVPEPVNAEVAKLEAHGVHAIVLLIHDGLQSPTTPEPAPLALEEVRGGLKEVVRGLDRGIDVIVAGHTHKLNNVLLPLRNGELALVTQARMDGTAFSAIDLTIDRKTGAVTAKSARVLTPWGDGGPGLSPVTRVARLVEAAGAATAKLEGRQIGVAATAIRRAESPSGESALGDLIADAERAAAGTDFAFVNPGGVRNDLESGPITFGAIYAVQPFGNTVMRLTLTGEQVLRLLDQQWSGPRADVPQYLRPSGLRYVYDLRRPRGERVIEARDVNGASLAATRRYSVAVNDFLAAGGDYYSVLAEGLDVVPVMLDVAALEAWIARAPGPLAAALDGRVQRLDAPRP
jgi:5'-nucleotidase